mgnify:CR=1 FL=1
MKALVETIAKALVAQPEAIEVTEVASDWEVTVSLKVAPEDMGKVIGKQGQNIKLASWLSGYEIDVYRESNEDDDVELDEFADDIEGWILNQFKKVGLTTAKSVLDKDTGSLQNMTDLEEETIEEVKQILKAEFED